MTHQPLAGPPPGGGLSALLKLLEPYRKRLIQASSSSVLNKLFDLAPPVLIALAIDVMANQQSAWLAQIGVRTVPSQLTLLAVLTFVIWSLESFFEYLYGVLWRGLG